MLFCIFCIELSLHLPSFIEQGLPMTVNVLCVWTDISRRHSNPYHHFDIQWLMQNGRMMNQHHEPYQREVMYDIFASFTKLERQKKSIGWAKYVYACKWDMCWRIFVSFPWWLKNLKNRSKIALVFEWMPFWKNSFRRKLS